MPARTNAAARAWRSTVHDRGSACPSRAPPCSHSGSRHLRARRAVCPVLETATTRFCWWIVPPCDFSCEASAASTSMGSNCACSGSTVAPCTANGTSRVSAQPTSSPSEAAASCSARTVSTSCGRAGIRDRVARLERDVVVLAEPQHPLLALAIRIHVRLGDALRLAAQDRRQARALQQRHLGGRVAGRDSTDRPSFDQGNVLPGPSQQEGRRQSGDSTADDQNVDLAVCRQVVIDDGLGAFEPQRSHTRRRTRGCRRQTQP